MEDDPKTPPAGTDDSKGDEGAQTPPATPPEGAEDKKPKGAPDEDQKAKRLQADLDAAKQREADLKKQLADAKTADEVAAAVKAAEETAAKQVKEIAVNAALLASNCLNTTALIAAAGIDLEKVEVNEKGEVTSGLDIKQLTADFPYLFKNEEDGATVVNSAAAPGGPAKKKTKEEILAITDDNERLDEIAANPDLFKNY